MTMGTDKWLSVGIIQSAGEPQVLQQKVTVGGVSSEYGYKPHRKGEHRLVSLSELTGVEPISEDVDVIQ